jgi:AraC family transcriptional regulator
VTRAPASRQPRLERHDALLIAGLAERYEAGTIEEMAAGIGRQWQSLAPLIGKVPGQVGRTAYGVCRSVDDGEAVDYLAGVEVASFEHLPRRFKRRRLPAQRYAVFRHRGHLSALPGTIDSIWSRWLPQARLEAADTVHLERYGERFDPQSGKGEVEIWIPVKS